MELETDANESVWTQIKSTGFEKRSRHSSIVFQNYIIIFGGYNRIPLGDFMVFDINTHEWRQIIPKGMLPIPRYGHSMCLSHNDDIIVFGGLNYPEVLSEIGITYINTTDPISIEWKIMKTVNDGPQRAFHSAHIYQNMLYTFGGWDCRKESTNELWQINLETLEWLRCYPGGDIPEQRESHSSTLHNGRMYVFGGYSTQNSIILGDLNMLDLGTMKWHKIIPTGSSPCSRYGTALQERGDKLYLFGGNLNDPHHYSNELYAYDINNNEWSQLHAKGDVPSPRRCHTLTWLGNNFLVCGGFGIHGHFSDLYSLSLQDRTTEIVRSIKKGNPVLKDLFRSQILADVIFKVQDQEIKAHKNILAGGCDHFRDLFTKMQGVGTVKIDIQNISADVFRAFLEFLYCDEVSIDERLAIDLIRLPDIYTLPELKQICQEFLVKRLNRKNCFEFAKLAQLYKASALEEAIIKFAAKNMKTLQPRGSLENFSNQTLTKDLSQCGSN